MCNFAVDTNKHLKQTVMQKKVYSFDELQSIRAILESRLDSIAQIAAKIESAGWNLYRSTENQSIKDFGAEMAALGSHMSWYIFNSVEAALPFDEFEKIELDKIVL